MKAKRKLICAAVNRAIDHITILWTEPGKVATKKFAKASRKSEITVAQYDAGYLFIAMKPIAISSIEDLSEVLKFLEKQHRALVIRGAPESDEIIGRLVTRTGSGDGLNFAGNFRTPQAGRHYIEIDVDKYALPDGLELTPHNLQKIAEHVVLQLPKEFHKASYHWQLSSSAGVFNKTKVSIHLWFWLALPVPDAELKIWGEQVNSSVGFKLIDLSLFQHVQAHYTAAPIFVGMNDPFPNRSGLVVKKMGSVNLKLPTVKATAPSQASAKITASRISSAGGFQHILSLVGDHPGGSGFHEPLRNAAASYVGTHGRDEVDVSVLLDLLRVRVQSSDHSKHSDTEFEKRSSDVYLRSLISSALDKYGDAAANRRKSKRIEGIKPHFEGEFQDPSEIQNTLRSIFDQAF